MVTDRPGPKRPPNWKWPELVLACALTARSGWHERDEKNAEVVALSQLLRQLPLHPEDVRGTKFRSPGSVRAKMMNLAHCHPDSSRKVSNRGPLDQEVVDAFLARPDEMFALADKLAAGGQASEVADGSEHVGGAYVSPPESMSELPQFKPGSDDALIAAVKAHYRVRSGAHGRLMNNFGTAIRASGFSVARDTPLGSLALSSGGRHWLVAAKVVRDGNATVAVQSVIGMLNYEKYFFRRDILIGMVALFSEDIGPVYVEFLESLGIGSIWWSRDTWCGSRSVHRDRLVPATGPGVNR